jgi:CBS domain-containing protein
MRTEQVMTRTVYCCLPTDTLERAALRMREHRVGLLPVVEESGRVIGVVTDRDICMGVLEQKVLLQEALVRSVMSPRLITCSVDDAVSEAEQAMRRAGVRRLPVLDVEGQLVGVLSLSDVGARVQERIETDLRNALGIRVGKPKASDDALYYRSPDGDEVMQYE